MVVVVEVGRVAVRLAAVVVDGAVRLLGIVADVNLPTGLLVEVAAREVVVAGLGATLALRSAVDEVVDFSGVRVEAVPAIDMRFAVLEIPFFSSPELGIDRFSSAELLIDARERCDEVVGVLNGLRVAEVVVGRVGGLFRVLELVAPRAVEAVVLDAVVDEVGRFVVVVVLEVGRLEAAFALGSVFAGRAWVFSLEASGLDWLTSSLPERTVESTGVAGGASLASTSEGTGTGSSVDAMVDN